MSICKRLLSPQTQILREDYVPRGGFSDVLSTLVCGCSDPWGRPSCLFVGPQNQRPSSEMLVKVSSTECSFGTRRTSASLRALQEKCSATLPHTEGFSSGCNCDSIADCKQIILWARHTILRSESNYLEANKHQLSGWQHYIKEALTYSFNYFAPR